MWFPCQLDTSVSTVPNIFTLIWGNLHGHPPLNLWISQRPMVQDTGGFFFQKYIPSGNLLHSYWKWPIFRWFTYETWWFSIAMLVYQRVIQNHHVISYNDPMKMIFKPLMIINPRILPLISTSSLGFSSPFSPLMRSFASVSWPRYRRDLTAFVCSYRCLGYPTSHSFGDVW